MCPIDHNQCSRGRGRGVGCAGRWWQWRGGGGGGGGGGGVWWGWWGGGGGGRRPPPPRGCSGGGGGVVVVVVSFVLVWLGGVAADRDAHADDGLSGVVCAPRGPPGAGVGGFAARQLVNAGMVVAVGKELRLPPRAWVVATATAM